MSIIYRGLDSYFSFIYNMYRLSTSNKDSRYHVLLYKEEDIFVLKNQIITAIFPDVKAIMFTISEKLAQQIHLIHSNNKNYDNCTVFTENFHWLACCNDSFFSEKENAKQISIKNSSIIKNREDLFIMSNFNNIIGKKIDLWIKVYWLLDSNTNKYKLNSQIVKIEFKN